MQKNALKIGVVVGLLAVLVLAAEKPQYPSLTTQADGLQLNLLVDSPNTRLNAADSIKYELLSVSTNKEMFVFLPEDPRYFCQAELSDTNGFTVPKTELGKEVGALFGDLAPSLKYDRQSGPFTIFMSATNQIKTRRIRIAGGASGPVFFRPIDLFKISKSGDYVLRLRFQILVPTTNASVKGIQFPELTIKTFKP